MKNIIFDLGSVLLKNKASSTLDNLNLDDETKNELRSDGYFLNVIEKKIDNKIYPMDLMSISK